MIIAAGVAATPQSPLVTPTRMIFDFVDRIAAAVASPVAQHCNRPAGRGDIGDEEVRWSAAKPGLARYATKYTRSLSF